MFNSRCFILRFLNELDKYLRPLSSIEFLAKSIFKKYTLANSSKMHGKSFSTPFTSIPLSKRLIFNY